MPRTVTVNGSTGHAKSALRNQLRSCPGPGPGPAQCASHGPGATVTWTSRYTQATQPQAAQPGGPDSDSEAQATTAVLIVVT